jgi:hypothetical protein
MEWTLASNGDKVEKDLGTDVCALFPNYQKFWAVHVVPLTYRVMNQDCIFVRAKVRPDFERMATANYAVFVHLAACHQQLRSPPEAIEIATRSGSFRCRGSVFVLQQALFRRGSSDR